MKKSFNTTLILIVVCAGLIGWYAIYEKKIKKTRGEAEEKAKSLVMLDKDQIQELSIKWNKNPPDKEGVTDKNVLLAPEWITIKLKKTGLDWNIVEPVQDSADNSVIAGMISTLVTSKQERVVEEKAKDLEPYSLKTPIVSVIIKKDSAAPAEEVDFGRATPVGYSVYAKNNPGDTIYRVAKAMRTGFEKDVNAIRNRNIFSVVRTDVTEFEIVLSKETITLKKDDKGAWLLASENLLSDVTEVNNTLAAITDLKILNFVSENAKELKPYGLNSPVASINLKKKENGKVGLLVGRVKDKVYVKREDKPNVYEVDKTFLDKILRSASVYRNKDLANFNRFDVKRIKLERGKEVLELLKEDSGWAIATEPGLKIDGTKVDGLLTKVQDTKLTEYLPASAAGDVKFKDPQLVLRFFEKKDKDKPETETVNLKFAKGKGNEIPVERLGLSFPFKIKDEDFKKILISKQDLAVKPEPEAKKEIDKKNKS